MSVMQFLDSIFTLMCIFGCIPIMIGVILWENSKDKAEEKVAKRILITGIAVDLIGLAGTIIINSIITT